MTAKISNNLKIKKNIDFYKSLCSGNYYLFTGKDTVWSEVEDSPSYVVPTPVVDNYNLQEELHDIIGLKKITTNNISLGIKRYNWNYGDIYSSYDYYDEFLNSKHFISNTRPFYVITDEFHIYKCLFNNNSAFSTIKPTGQAYTPIELADGYIWKYMFTVPEDEQLTFLTSSHIPLKCNDELIVSSTQQLVSAAAIAGTIDIVTITSGGSGYEEGTTSVTASDIDGTVYKSTGSGFTTSAEIVDGVITKVNVTSPGSGYTSKAIIVIQGEGTSATMEPQISPIGGHGFDAAFELGALYILISVQLDNNDLTYFPTSTTYRKVGVITGFKEYNTSNVYTQTYYYGPRHPDFADSTLRTNNPELFIEEYIGDVLYINYIPKVTRQSNMVETIRFVISTN